MTNDNGFADGLHEFVPKYERRWMVLEEGPDFRATAGDDKPPVTIQMGFLDGAKTVCIRVMTDVNGNTWAVASFKIGTGRARRERTINLSVEQAEFMLQASDENLSKIRRYRDGWNIDDFTRDWRGMTLIEIKKPSLAELDNVVLPPWVKAAEEVTGTLTNRTLARIAKMRRGAAPLTDLKAIREAAMRRMLRHVAVSGGPGSGKTGFMDAIKLDYADLLMSTPEAATFAIHQVQAPPPIGDVAGMRRYQRDIYELQLLIEGLAHRQALRQRKRALLLDRGTVDGAAYMTNGLADLPGIFGNPLEDEYARYHGIIFMATPPREVYETIKGNNAARYETYEQAVVTGQKLFEVWKGHPRFRYIDNGSGWDDKLARARAALDELLALAP